MKQKTKRVLILAALLIFCFSTTALAANKSMENGGYAYLNVAASGGLKKADAGTIRGDVTNKTSVKVITTYTDGSEEVYDSGKVDTNAAYSSTWEWAEDYVSEHTLYNNEGTPYDTVNLP